MEICVACIDERKGDFYQIYGHTGYGESEIFPFFLSFALHLLIRVFFCRSRVISSPLPRQSSFNRMFSRGLWILTWPVN